MLEDALKNLQTYEWGADVAQLQPIEDAIAASWGKEDDRRKIETALIEVLQSDAPRAAKDYVCRKLRQIGSAACVPALAALLASSELSHMARYALDRNPDSAADKALRDALTELDGALRIGVIGSLGARGEAASVTALAPLLSNSDPAVARSAAQALGVIGSAAAAQALSQARSEDASVKRAVIDASLSCADGLIAAGKKAEALAIYRKYSGEDQPKHVRLAATRGMLAATSG